MKESVKKFFKRFGLIGFWFFLIKGLAWLIIFIFFGKWFSDNF